MSSEVAVGMQGGRWKRYPAYRDSGVEWLGKVPEGWIVNKLRFYINVNPTKSEVQGLAPDTAISFVPMEAVGEYGGLCLDQTKSIENVIAGYTYFRDDDVVVAKITPCFENGKGAVIKGLKNGIGFGTTELHVLRPSNNIDCNFLFYITISYTFRKLGESEMYGAAGQKRVPENFIKNLKHPIPTFDEQRTIAAFLDRETGRIDALIEKKERQIELLQEKRAALISHAVTKGLDPDVKMKDSGVEWIGEVPEGWGASKIIRHAYLKTGGTPDRNNAAYWENGTINWMSSGEVNKKKILETNNKITIDGLANSNAMILPINSIMIALNGQGKTKGTAAVLKIESSCNQSLAAFICDEKKLHFNYLFYYLESKYKELRGLVGDGLRDGLSLGHLKSIYSPLPPLSEQRAIAAFLDRETGRIDTLITKIRESISKLREYRTALISAAVTGKIDVREGV